MKLLVFVALLTLSGTMLTAQTARFPASVAGDAHLQVAANRAQSTLSAAIDSAATTISVANGTAFRSNSIVTIDNERISICGVSGNTLTVGYTSCPSADGRGFDGSSAAAHISGATVSAYVSAWYHNALKEEIKAIETQLGAGMANVVPPTRSVLTTAPLAGGGNFSSDRTLSITGLSSVGAANQLPGVNVGGTAWEYKTLSGASNEIAVTHGAGSIGVSIASSFDISGKTSTKPVKTGTAAPATCSVGELFYDTDAVAGMNLFLCTAANTWKQMFSPCTLDVSGNLSCPGSYTSGSGGSGKLTLSGATSGSIDLTVNAVAGTGSVNFTGANGNVITSASPYGYALQFFSGGTFNPANATTYCIGWTQGAPTTSCGGKRIHFPRAGTVKVVYVVFTAGTVGTAETSTVSLQINGGAPVAISSQVNNSTSPSSVSNTAMSTTVNQGDYFEISWTTPTWATQPLTVTVSGTVYVE